LSHPVSALDPLSDKRIYTGKNATHDSHTFFSHAFETKRVTYDSPAIF